jgi:hypothetical protein
MTFKFEISDVVKVIRPGALYSSYTKAAGIMNLKKYRIEYSLTKLYVEYTILDRMYHLYTKAPIYGITDGTHDFIIGEEGLRFIRAGIKEQEVESITQSPVKFDISLIYNFDV